LSRRLPRAVVEASKAASRAPSSRTRLPDPAPLQTTDTRGDPRELPAPRPRGVDGGRRGRDAWGGELSLRCDHQD
jgi:hypothetical protein